MLFSILAGYILRNRLNERLLNRLLMLSIYLLLFLMGVSIGTNEQLVKNLSALGLQALVLTLGAVAGSLIAAKILFYLWKKRKN